MTKEAIEKARYACNEFLRRQAICLQETETAERQFHADNPGKKMLYAVEVPYGRAAAALKRQSLELSMVLADLRRGR